MSVYFKVSDLQYDTPTQIDLVKYNPTPVQGQFGDQWDAEVNVNGQTKMWTMSSNMKAQLDKLGITQAPATFFIKKFKGAKGPGYQYLPQGDIQTQPQNISTPKYKTPTPKPAPIDTQERILRGMCFNNTCTLLAGTTKDPLVVKQLTKDLYKVMKPWLIGEEEKLPEPPTPDTDLPF